MSSSLDVSSWRERWRVIYYVLTEEREGELKERGMEG